MRSWGPLALCTRWVCPNPVSVAGAPVTCPREGTALAAAFSLPTRGPCHLGSGAPSVSVSLSPLQGVSLCGHPACGTLSPGPAPAPCPPLCLQVLDTVDQTLTSSQPHRPPSSAPRELERGLRLPWPDGRTSPRPPSEPVSRRRSAARGRLPASRRDRAGEARLRSSCPWGSPAPAFPAPPRSLAAALTPPSPPPSVLMLLRALRSFGGRG